MKIASIVLREFKGEAVGDVFGVDSGAWFCLANNIKMKAACGDFDSINIEQKQAVFSLDIPIYELNREKDYTDFEYCLSLCADYDEIYVFGSLGGRRDHEYLNLEFAKRDSRIILIDELNRIRKVESGQYTIKKDGYKYLSFIVLENSMISIEDVRYPLIQREVDVKDTYLSSNEILFDEAKLEVHYGSFLMIQSNDA